MERLFYICGSVAGLAGVALGAFGAHALKSRLSAGMLAVFETGVRYQTYYGLAVTNIRWLGMITPLGGLAYYADVPEDTLRDFVTRQQLGRLQRGRPTDAGAADALSWSLDRGSSK